MPRRNRKEPALLFVFLLLSFNLAADAPLATPSSTSSQLSEALLLEKRARESARDGRAEEAETLAAQALSLREAALGRDTVGTIPALQALATAHVASGRVAEAKALLEQTLELRVRALGANHPSLANDVYQIGEFERAHGDLEAAARHLSRARSLLERAPRPRAREVAVVLGSLALVRSEQGRSYDAEEIVDGLLVHLDAAEESAPAVLVLALDRIAFDSWGRGETVHAEALYERLVAVCERAFGPRHPELAVPLVNLGFVRSRRGETSAALALYHRALSLLDASVQVTDPRTVTTLERLILLCAQAGKERDARRYRARLAQATEAAASLVDAAQPSWQRERD